MVHRIQENLSKKVSSWPFFVQLSPQHVRSIDHSTISQPNSGKEKTKKCYKNFLLIDLEKEASTCSGFYGLLIILLVVSSTLMISIIPQHDAIKYPSFWPERLLRSTNYYMVLVFCLSFDYQLIMNPRETFTAKQVFYSLLIVIIFMSILSLIFHIVWIYALDYRPPVPFLGILLRWISCVVFYIPFWALQPRDQRNDIEYTERFKWLMLTNVLFQVVFVAYYFSVGLFKKIPHKWQPIAAFLFPIIRYVCLKIIQKPTFKARGENASSSQVSMGCKIACNHALCLSLIIGGGATEATSAVLYLIDALLNLYSCYNIVKLHRKNEDVSKVMLSVQALIIKEILQILIPLSYSLILCLSYYGPNAEMIGNMKNEYWQFHKIEDISSPLKKIAILVIVDWMLLFFSALILWKCCKILLINEYARIMEIYWKPITFYISTTLLMVSKLI